MTHLSLLTWALVLVSLQPAVHAMFLGPVAVGAACIRYLLSDMQAMFDEHRFDMSDN